MERVEAKFHGAGARASEAMVNEKGDEGGRAAVPTRMSYRAIPRLVSQCPRVPLVAACFVLAPFRDFVLFEDWTRKTRKGESTKGDNDRLASGIGEGATTMPQRPARFL